MGPEWDGSQLLAAVCLVLPCCWSRGCKQCLHRHTQNRCLWHAAHLEMNHYRPFTLFIPGVSKTWVRSCLSVLSGIHLPEEPHWCEGWRDWFTNRCSRNVQGALGSQGAKCWELACAWRQLQVGSAGLGAEKERIHDPVTSHVWLSENGIWDPKTD